MSNTQNKANKANNARIKTKLNGVKTTLKPSKKIGLGDGYCKFPFIYHGKEYNKCIKNSEGDRWCASEVDSDNIMVKRALCDLDQKTKPKPKPKSNNTKPMTEAENKILKTYEAEMIKEFPKIKLTDNEFISLSNKVELKYLILLREGKLKPKQKTKSKKVVFKPKPTPKTKKVVFKFKPTPKTKKAEFSEQDNFSIETINPNFKKSVKKRVTSDNWELPNRKVFSNWFNKIYEPYRARRNSLKTGKPGSFELFNHQKLVRDFINTDSPYRGVLLFHGLGVGKTCASIGIAESFRGETREIIILLNKSLKKNFKVNLMKCGFEFYRINSHWFYHKFTLNDPMYSYGKYIGIPLKILRTGGAWFVDFSKKSNYSELTQKQQDTLNEQIEAFIDKKYRFVHIDGLNKTKLESMVEKRVFDNKLVIIDEAHNLTNAMSKTFPGIRGKLLKKLLMEADNLKLVFLTGTPMINNLFETAQLFNLLRGYIFTFHFILNEKTNNTPFDSVVKKIKSHPLIDQVIGKKSDRVITVTRTPYGFINNNNNGVTKDDMNRIDNDTFIEIIKTELGKMNYNSNINIVKNTALPDNEELFMKLFYDESKNLMRNPLLYQSRIMGLVSYFRTQDKSLLPTVTKNVVEEVEMSEYQFLNYSVVRKDEIDQDKTKKSKSKKPAKKKGSDKSEGDGSLFDDKKSSYRAYSRMHCSFVFPETHPRPYPNDLTGAETDVLNDVLDKQVDPLNNKDDKDDKDEEELKAEKKLIIKRYEMAKTQILKELDRNKETLFTLDDPEQLLKYSPKYNSIISKIQPLNGTAFIYTEYKTLEGIAVLQIVLKANGYAPFLLEKNSDGDIIQVFESPEDVVKPKYAFWGGNAEESDIIRKVYNNEHDELPPSLKKQIEKTGRDNLRGDIIKILLTTKTGAEGIDLHNVRQVHIVEPYWNPVRTEQVKGRAVRVGSHTKLPKKDQTVEIFSYVSKISIKDLKSDKTILDDSDGMCSDQVLFDISQRKQQVMTHLLQLIKEVSVDCSINIAETKDEHEDLKCFSYGTSLSRDNYSYYPAITRDQQDTEIKRKFKKVQWKPEFITLKRKGVEITYAIKKTAKPGDPDLIFDADATRSGQPGDPIGHCIKMDGKTKFKFYKK